MNGNWGWGNGNCIAALSFEVMPLGNIFAISESWSDETISLRDVAVGHLAIGCGVSLRGKPLPFLFCYLL